MPKFNRVPSGIGSETYYFNSDNPVLIPKGANKPNEFYELYPVSTGDFYTEEIGQGFERSYFIIKFFQSVDETTFAVVTADVSGTTSGDITITATPDPLGLGARRYKTVGDGEFAISDTDAEARVIPAVSGPIRNAKLTMDALPNGATHFYAYLIKY